FAANYKYNESLSTLMYHPYSWTKFSSVIFVDIPVGTGFSFAKDSASADEVGDMSSSLQVYDFLTKTVPLVAHLISKGINAGKQPLLNLKGYPVGNPFTGEKVDMNPHGMGLISDGLSKVYSSFIRYAMS
ncbi:unnamed protein product, partial [Musa hybrid cultivar]